MILKMEIQAVKSSLGKTQKGAEITLADAARPQCLVPFSYYVGDVAAFEDKHKVKLADLRFKNVIVLVTSMSPSAVGNSIKLDGELTLDINPKESK